MSTSVSLDNYFFTSNLTKYVCPGFGSAKCPPPKACATDSTTGFQYCCDARDQNAPQMGRVCWRLVKFSYYIATYFSVSPRAEICFRSQRSLVYSVESWLLRQLLGSLLPTPFQLFILNPWTASEENVRMTAVRATVAMAKISGVV
jgi:hypothetical protein